MPQCLAAQRVAAEAVRDGERIALRAGAELEVPLEVGRPHGIGLGLCTKAVGPERIAGCLQRYHQVSVAASSVHRILCRHGLNRLAASQKYRRHKQH